MAEHLVGFEEVSVQGDQGDGLAAVGRQIFGDEVGVDADRQLHQPGPRQAAGGHVVMEAVTKRFVNVPWPIF